MPERRRLKVRGNLFPLSASPGMDLEDDTELLIELSCGSA